MSKTQRPTERRHDEVVTERIVETVADARDVDPVDLPPLYTAIDPDALNAMFDTDRRAPGRPDRLEFHYVGRVVVVAGDGSVTAEPAAGTDESVESAAATDEPTAESVESAAGTVDEARGGE